MGGWKNPSPQRLEVIARDGMNCKLCGESRERLLELDHIVPTAAGGGANANNLQILCRSCHDKKDAGVASKYPNGRKELAKQKTLLMYGTADPQEIAKIQERRYDAKHGEGSWKVDCLPHYLPKQAL